VETLADETGTKRWRRGFCTRHVQCEFIRRSHGMRSIWKFSKQDNNNAPCSRNHEQKWSFRSVSVHVAMRISVQLILSQTFTRIVSITMRFRELNCQPRSKTTHRFHYRDLHDSTVNKPYMYPPESVFRYTVLCGNFSTSNGANLGKSVQSWSMFVQNNLYTCNEIKWNARNS
jgi:hypothetical protein